jgi:tetratricopeptide (TPR) repeat protein
LTATLKAPAHRRRFFIRVTLPSLAQTLEQATQLQADGKNQEALAVLDACRRQGEFSPALWRMMGEAFAALGMSDGEEKILHEGVKHHPGDLGLIQALAHLYYRANRLIDGLTLLAPFTAQKNCPDEIRVTQAGLLRALGNIEEAQKMLENVLTRHPRYVAALSNLAGIFLDKRAYTKAIPLFEKALELDPTNSHIATQLAHAAFRVRDLPKGWRHYDARFGLKENDPHATSIRRPFSQPLWQGEKLGPDHPLLLWTEQGIGEEILYASMLEDARHRCVNIMVECEARLVPLFSRSFLDVLFVPRATPPDRQLSNIAFQAPMGHLGKLFRTKFESFLVSPPYLQADPQKTAAIRARYEEVKKSRDLTGRNIGISWRSKPLRHGDPKSTELSAWMPLFKNNQHLFVSLQHEATPEDFLSAPIYEDKNINQKLSVDDFAAQTAAMDAVITVSNTTAHMAGALGVTTAVLLPASRGLMWHWFDGMEGSPWYPSLTLLRQKTDGDWADVFVKAGDFLQQL